MPQQTTSAAEHDLIGGRFRVLARAGSGGVADVYRVRDERSGEVVALKRLRQARPERIALALSLFEREYYTLRQLAHPGIIRVHDYGVEDGGAFYTMELLEGSEVLALGKQPWRDACRVLRDVASALAMLHARRWLHRDLSPRNVFVTKQGGAKLIDFGAMAPMGVARTLIGTPPLVPPEAVQQQMLDAQADLYSLGALGYFMLTGRHAFPARSFDELRDAWRSLLRAPDQLVRDIPQRLSQLVIDLMHLDRFARPASAAAVIERLDALLGPDAPKLELPAVGQAYLATPKLIGRDRELSRVRERMVHALRGRGSVVLLEGELGSGRSRLLDACVLEARLLGARVLRADASDGSRGDYGAVSALAEQLFELMPEVAKDAARLRQAELGTVIASLREHDGAATTEPSAPEGPHSERRHVQTALRDWFRAIARRERIVLAVDDLDRIDEHSMALLAALAHKSERRKLVLVASVRRDAAASPALELLREVAMRVDVTPLSVEQTVTLLESIFGASAQVEVLAHLAHERAEGNPRRLVALAEHLVQSGLARYAAGSWSLPERLDLAHLPSSVEGAFASRIADLPPSARALAETLALTDPRVIPLADYGALCEAEDRAHVFESVAALLEAGILAPEGERYRMTLAGLHASPAGSLDPARARTMHQRLAQVLKAAGDTLRAAHHYFESGDEREALALLVEHRSSDSALLSEAAVQLLERAVAVAERLPLPQREQLELRVSLTEAAAALGRLDVFQRVAQGTLDGVVTASGLRDFAALDSALPSTERMKQALAIAQERYDATSGPERTISPLQALSRLARVELAFANMAGTALELSLARDLPSLAPLAPLAPSLPLIDETATAVADHLEGRYARSRQRLLSVLERIDAPDGAGMNDVARKRSRLNTLYGLGILEAVNGGSDVLERIEVLEQEPGYRVNAWRLRMLYHASRGELDEAQLCERRARLLLLQDGSQPFLVADMQAEAGTRFVSDDLDGLRQMLPRLQDAAEHYPGRGPLLEVAQCQLLRLKGDPAAALEQLLPLVAVSSPATSVRFAWIGGTHLMLLQALGRHEEAAVIGEQYLEASLARGLQLIDCTPILRPLCEALAHSDPARAVALSEALVAGLEAIGASGLLLGSVCEARARIALTSRNADDYALWSDRCRKASEHVRNPALSAKLARLQRDAQLAHLADPLGHSEPPDSDTDLRGGDAAVVTVHSRMAECVDAGERARCVLRLLVEESGAATGHLFGLLTGRLLLLASLPEGTLEQSASGAVMRCVERELRASDTTAAGGREHETSDDAGPTAGLTPVLLWAVRDAEPTIAAVAMLALRATDVRRPRPVVLRALAESLLEHDDVDAFTRLP